MPRCCRPLPRWWTTWAAVRLPLNLSGAMRTFIAFFFLSVVPGWRKLWPCVWRRWTALHVDVRLLGLGTAVGIRGRRGSGGIGEHRRRLEGITDHRGRMGIRIRAQPAHLVLDGVARSGRVVCVVEVGV